MPLCESAWCLSRVCPWCPPPSCLTPPLVRSWQCCLGCKNKNRRILRCIRKLQKKASLSEGDETRFSQIQIPQQNFALLTQHSTEFASHQQLDQTSLLPGGRKIRPKKVTSCPCLPSALPYTLQTFRPVSTKETWKLWKVKRPRDLAFWNSPSTKLWVGFTACVMQWYLYTNMNLSMMMKFWLTGMMGGRSSAKPPKNRAKTSVIIPSSTCVSSVHESRPVPLRSSSAETVLTQGPDTECLLLRCSHDFKLMKNWLLLWNPSEATLKSDRKKSKAQLATGNKLWQENKAKYPVLLKRVHSGKVIEKIMSGWDT